MAREESFFDELARGLADGSVTRGRALRLMGAALVGGALASLGIGEAGADELCKPEGKKCRKDKQCCSGKCEGGTCAAACGSNGATCTEGTQCCSGNCKGGMCVESCIPPNAIPCDTGGSGACPPNRAAAAVSENILLVYGTAPACALLLAVQPPATVLLGSSAVSLVAAGAPTGPSVLWRARGSAYQGLS